MSDPRMQNRDPHALTPPLLRRWTTLYHVMQIVGHPIFLTEGLRTSERQAWLYDQGRTRPGPIVTNAEPGESSHNPNAQGLSEALDFAFAAGDPFGEDHPWDLVGQLAKVLGLRWGGDWRKPDRPHLYV